MQQKQQQQQHHRQIRQPAKNNKLKKYKKIPIHTQATNAKQPKKKIYIEVEWQRQQQWH